MTRDLLQIVKSNYRQNWIGYACLGVIFLTILIFNGICTYRCDAGIIDDIHGMMSYDYDYYVTMERLATTNLFVTHGYMCINVTFAITLIVLACVFVLSLRNRQRSLKRTEQILFTGLSVLIYSVLLYLFAYWFGQVSVLTGGSAARSNHFLSEITMPNMEILFCIVTICVITFIYVTRKFILFVIRKNSIAGILLAMLAIIIILFIFYVLLIMVLMVGLYL